MTIEMMEKMIRQNRISSCSLLFSNHPPYIDTEPFSLVEYIVCMANSNGQIKTINDVKNIPPHPSKAVVLPPLYKVQAAPHGKYTASRFAWKRVHKPLPVKLHLVRTLKRGIPRPMIKNAKTMEQTSVKGPKTPDIIL